MKNLRTIVIIVAVLIFFLIKFKDRFSKSAQQPTASTPATASAPAEKIADTWNDDSWPPKGEGEIELVSEPTIQNYYVVLDGSGSMEHESCYGKTQKMAQAKQALIHFAQMVPKNANLGLAVFTSSATREVLSLGTGNRDQFIQTVNSVRPSGSTPLLSAIDLARQRIGIQARKQLGYGEYHLVIVTDGEADQGQDPRPVVDRILRATPIAIHTVGFCIGNDHSLNQPGKIVFRAANTPEELKRDLTEVLAESPKFIATKFESTK